MKTISDKFGENTFLMIFNLLVWVTKATIFMRHTRKATLGQIIFHLIKKRTTANWEDANFFKKSIT